MAVVLSPAARAAIDQLQQRRSEAPARSDAKTGPGFGEVLKEAMSEAHEAEQQADAKAQAFAQGNAGIHETIIAQEKAGIAVRYAVTVKNKALEAYREIMNTQV